MDNEFQLVTFFLGSQMFGIDIRLIKEINPNVDICHVPRSERYIRGLLNIRGQVVLVMDTATILGQAPSVITNQTHVIILKTIHDVLTNKNIGDAWEVVNTKLGDLPLGFVVDKIGDVMTINRDKIEPPPRHLDVDKSLCFQGVVRLEEQVLLILNVGEMVQEDTERRK